MVHGKDRTQAISRAQAAVAATHITGMATTLPLHQWLVADARVQAARFDTGALESWLAERANARTAQLEEACDEPHTSLTGHAHSLQHCR